VVLDARTLYVTYPSLVDTPRWNIFKYNSNNKMPWEGQSLYNVILIHNVANNILPKYTIGILQVLVVDITSVISLLYMNSYYR